MMPTVERQSLDQRWQQYQELDLLRNHWYWRPGWHTGRRFYTWHLTFGDAADLQQVTTVLTQDLDFGCLDHVPAAGLHLTMQGLGFTDEVSDSDVNAIVEAARHQCQTLEPFDLTLGPVDPDAEGIGLLVSPWDPIIHLRNAIRRAIQEIWGHVPEPALGFRPHVTVAYSGADAPAEPIRTRLARLRGLPPVSAHVAAAQLIRLDRDHKEYRWAVHAGVELGRSSNVGPNSQG